MPVSSGALRRRRSGKRQRRRPIVQRCEDPVPSLRRTRSCPAFGQQPDGVPSLPLSGCRRQYKLPVQLPAIVRETGLSASHSPPSPPQPHIGLTQRLCKFTALPCAFHPGFGLGTVLVFSFRFILYLLGRGAGPTRRVRTLAHCGGESLGQSASASLMAWVLLWKPVKPSRTTRRLSTWANMSSLLRPAFCSKPASRHCWSSPSCLPTVRAGLPDRSAPLHPTLGGDLPPAVQAPTQVCVMVLQVLRHEFQAVLASLHLVGIVGVDRGHAVVPAQGAVPGAVVDHPAVFVRRVVPLRSLVRQGRLAEAFRGVVGPAPWVAEGELRIREQGVEDCCWPSS